MTQPDTLELEMPLVDETKIAIYVTRDTRGPVWLRFNRGVTYTKLSAERALVRIPRAYAEEMKVA